MTLRRRAPTGGDAIAGALDEATAVVVAPNKRARSNTSDAPRVATPPVATRKRTRSKSVDAQRVTAASIVPTKRERSKDVDAQRVTAASIVPTKYIARARTNTNAASAPAVSSKRRDRDPARANQRRDSAFDPHPSRSHVVAVESLARVANKLREPKRGARGTRSAPAVRGSSLDAGDGGPLNTASAARAVSLELIAGRAHYERIISAILNAHTSVWIATANVKGLMVEDGRAAPGRRRSMRRSNYVSVLSLLDELAQRGVELRLLHAELPSGPFREELAHHPRLVGGGLALARCPRVHMKAVIVDGELLYLGSANWTGAGLGAKGSGRRNFELGIVTDDSALLDQVQGMFERVWSGGECAGCKLKQECPGPLAELHAGRRARSR